MIDICLSTISLTPQHTYFVLTKRAEAINAKLYEPDETAPIRVLGPGDWYENLWIGVSAETNDLWIERWTALCRSGWQGKKFVSLEPLLRPVTFLEPITRMRIKGIPAQEPDWVIVGAETGSGHRSMELDWARDIRNPCVADHIPFFFKRDSDGSHLLDGRACEQFPEGLQDGR